MAHCRAPLLPGQGDYRFFLSPAKIRQVLLDEQPDIVELGSYYTEPWAAGLTGLKRELEAPMEKVFEIYIRTTPDRLWRAITDPAIREKYHFGVGAHSDWNPGSRYQLLHRGADGPLAEGESGPGRMSEPAEIVAALQQAVA